MRDSIRESVEKTHLITSMAFKSMDAVRKELIDRDKNDENKRRCNQCRKYFPMEKTTLKRCKPSSKNKYRYCRECGKDKLA